MPSQRNDNTIHKSADAGRATAEQTARTAQSVGNEAGKAGEQMARTAQNVANETGRAGEQAARTAQNVAEETGRAGEQAARAGADIVGRGAETARDAVNTGVTSALDGVRRVSEQFTQVMGFEGPRAEELARTSSRNMEAVSQAGAVLAKGTQEISQECLQLIQTRLTRILEALNRLAGCRSFQDVVAFQSDFVRDNLQLSLENGRRLAELSMRVAREASGPIQAQTDRNAVELDRSANQARRAA